VAGTLAGVALDRLGRAGAVDGYSPEEAANVDSPQLEAYRRLAVMDLPALRSLIVELVRMCDESVASAERQGTAEAAARALRDAQRAEAARAALATAEDGP